MIVESVPSAHTIPRTEASSDGRAPASIGVPSAEPSVRGNLSCWRPLDSTGPLSDDDVASTLPREADGTFHKLFGSLLAFVYRCFNGIVIQGYLPLLTRPKHIVHFFRDVQGIYPIAPLNLAVSSPAKASNKPPARIETAYHKADAAIQNLIDMVAA